MAEPEVLLQKTCNQVAHTGTSYCSSFAANIKDAENGGGRTPSCSHQTSPASNSTGSQLLFDAKQTADTSYGRQGDAQITGSSADETTGELREKSHIVEEIENQFSKDFSTSKNTPSLKVKDEDLQGRIVSNALPNEAEKKQSGVGDGIEHIIEESYETYPEGWSQLSNFLNFSSTTAISRRFGTVHTRLLLHRSVTITDLENQLDVLDRKDAEDLNMEYRQRGHILMEGDDTKKKELIDDLWREVSEYDDLLLKYHKLRALTPAPRRDWQSVFNWIYGCKPLYKGSYDFIYHRDDFISLSNKCPNGFEDFVVNCVNRWPRALQKPFKYKTQVKKETVHYFSRGKVIFTAKLLAVGVQVTALLMPVILLALLNLSMTVALVIILIFVLGFSALMSLSTAAKTETVFIGTCTYAAILVVFLGNMQERAISGIDRLQGE